MSVLRSTEAAVPEYDWVRHAILRSLGMLKEVDNVRLPTFDQKNKYDFAARLKENDVGTSGSTHPFKQTLGYDAFGNLTARNTKTYSFADWNFSTSYTNNREGGANIYDAAGNLTYAAPSGDYKEWEFDASGRQWKWEEPIPGASAVKYEETAFDGDGRPVRPSRTETSSPPVTHGPLIRYLQETKNPLVHVLNAVRFSIFSLKSLVH